jgi:beta-glucanase (GH16 family)
MTAHPYLESAGRVPARSRRRVLTVFAAAVTLLVGGVATAINASAAAPGPPAGWNTVFLDDFNGPAGSGINTGNWQYTTGTSYPGGPANFGTSEVETMTNSSSNVSLDGAGNLRITPQRGGPTGWTSGRIETNRSDFQPPPGGKLRVQARIQQPNVSGAGALGYWPAFWMLGAPYRGNWWNWPGVGEIDIMENVNGRDRNHGTLHCGTSPGGECGEKVGIGNNIACPGSNCTGNFHTYAVEWDRSTNPEQLRFFVDSTQYHTISSNQVSPGTWASATNHGFFIIMNVAMGGEFPNAFGGGPTGSTTSGAPMVVDYVAVYSTSGGSNNPPPPPGPPPPPPPPSCTNLLSQNQPVQASSIESVNQQAPFAVDGNLGTRWSSAHTDEQWIQVDLGSAKAINRVSLNWEVAFSRSYDIQTSNDGANWTTRYSTQSGDGGIDDIGISATARYVRMFGHQRGTIYGHSLWEFQVCGPGGTNPPPPGPPPPPPPPGPQPPPPPPPPPSGTWAPGVFYPVGATVTFGGLSYRCLQAHTSQVTWEPPNVPALWQRL